MSYPDGSHIGLGVTQPGVGVRVNRQHGSGRIQDVGPIGRCGLERGHANLPTGAGFVVHKDVVGVSATQLLSNPTGKGIGRPTGRETHNDAQIFQARLCKVGQMGQAQHTGGGTLHQLAAGGWGRAPQVMSMKKRSRH